MPKKKLSKNQQIALGVGIGLGALALGGIGCGLFRYSRLQALVQEEEGPPHTGDCLARKENPLTKFFDEKRELLSRMGDDDFEKLGITRDEYKETLSRTQETLGKLDARGVKLLNIHPDNPYELRHDVSVLGNNNNVNEYIFREIDRFIHFSRTESFDPEKVTVESAFMIDTRVVVKTRYTGYTSGFVTFYKSTGTGQKSGVPSNRFYYLPAYNITEQRLVKLPEVLGKAYSSDEDYDDIMRTHGSIQFLQDFASYLDTLYA
jgi:hypothetical protein